VEKWAGHKWQVWDKYNPPSEDEFSFVAFRNLVCGARWVQIDAVARGQFWYDNEPYAWLPKEAWPQAPRHV